MPHPRSPTDPSIVEQRRAAPAGATRRPNSSSRRRSQRPGGRREELLRLRLPPCQHAFQPPCVLIGAGRDADLLAKQRPQPPRRLAQLVERQRVVAAGPVPPGRDPAGVGQRFQVPADGGLRQLEDRAQLRHRQLVPFEHEQHPAARGIGQRRQVVEDCRFHPYIRIECYMTGRLVSRQPREARERAAVRPREH